MGIKGLIIEDATILSGPDWKAIPDSVVMIEDGLIAKISSTGKSEYPNGVRIIDGHGKFLIPGFIDMHTHCHTSEAIDFLSEFGPKLYEPNHRDWFLKLFLAYGVTTIRDLGNFPEIFDLKKECSGGTTSPSMIVAGELLEGAEPLWPLSRKVVDAEAVKYEVKRQKQLGADWIKLYVGLEPSVTKAAIEEAHSLDMRVAGHIWRTTATEAARMGIDSLEHTLTLADESFLSDKDQASLPGPKDNTYRPDRFRQMWSKANLDSESAIDLINALKESKTAVCPTLLVHENTMKGPNESFKNFAFDLVPQKWLEIWDGRFKIFHPEGTKTPDPVEGFNRALELVSKLYMAGVRILGGTDAALWNPYMVPGASIHRELELLVSAGLTLKDALSSVSCYAAETLGLANELGTIEKGKRADMVLLRNDPTRDIIHTRDIEMVVNKGHTFSPEDLLEDIGPVE